jgi:hypothetical protein
MIMLRSFVFVTALCVFPALYAATEFPGNLIPGDVAEAFAFGKIYRSLPENFPVPALPASLNLYVIASEEAGWQRLLLGTTHSGAELREILKSAYVGSGWLDLSTSPNGLDLCHDTYGILSFRMADPVGSENRVMVTRFPGRPGSVPDCAQRWAGLNGGPPSSEYQAFLSAIPTFKMPEETIGSGSTLPYGSLAVISGAGIDYDEQRYDITLTVPRYSLVKLHEHFSRQLIEAGWKLDTDSIGMKSTSAVWFKTVQVQPSATTPGYQTIVTGIMTLLNQKEDIYRLILAVQAGNTLEATKLWSYATVPTGVPGKLKAAP